MKVVEYVVEPELEDLVDENLLMAFRIPPLPSRTLNFPPSIIFPFEINSDCCDLDLSSYIYAWLHSRAIEEEAGIIGRDDGLFNIIGHLSGLNSASRDLHHISSIENTRYDRTDLKNGIPLILTEEKSETSIQQSQQDLIQNFHWIPHFRNLPYVFCFAINRNEIVVASYYTMAVLEKSSLPRSVLCKSVCRDIINCFSFLVIHLPEMGMLATV